MGEATNLHNLCRDAARRAAIVLSGYLHAKERLGVPKREQPLAEPRYATTSTIPLTSLAAAAPWSQCEAIDTVALQIAVHLTWDGFRPHSFCAPSAAKPIADTYTDDGVQVRAFISEASLMFDLAFN